MGIQRIFGFFVRGICISTVFGTVLRWSMKHGTLPINTRSDVRSSSNNGLCITLSKTDSYLKYQGLLLIFLAIAKGCLIFHSFQQDEWAWAQSN